jgi:hypothetical protein
MATDTAPPEFHLHFEGEETRDHTVPAAALVQAVQSIQRSIQLLASAYEGQEQKQRFRVSHDMERKYAVVFGIPQQGGYDIPYHIGSTALALFDPNDIAAVTKQYQDVLEAIDAGNAQAFRRTVPVADIRRKLLNEFKKLQPPRRIGVVVSIEDARRRKLLDGRTVAEKLAPLDADITPSVVQTRLVTGRLDALEFQKLSLRMTLPTGKTLEGTYADDFEPLLVENRRQLIQVRGEAVLNDDGSLHALNNITEIIEIDESPITVADFIHDNRTLTTTGPLEFEVAFDPDDGTGIYTATGPFHMLASGETRNELERAIKQALAFLWCEYVEAPPDQFSADSYMLRHELIKSFGGAPDAA